MAACVYCGDQGVRNRHGQLTHVGICRVQHLVTRAQTAASATKEAAAGCPSMRSPSPMDASPPPSPVPPPEAEDAAPVASGDEDEANPAPTVHPFKSDADWELVQLVAAQDTLPSGILGDLMRIFRTGKVTFSSVYAIHRAMDALPGSSFIQEDIPLKPIPGCPYHKSQGPCVVYTTFYRELRPMIEQALSDCQPGDFVLQSDHDVVDHIVSAEHYRALVQTLHTVTGDDTALLIPLVFHSGLFLICFCFFVTSEPACYHDIFVTNFVLADETPLTVFNSSSAASQAYPVYMVNGLLRHSLVSDALDVVALLPTYNDTLHPLCTTDQHSVNRTLLTWEAMTYLLSDFTSLLDDEDDAESFFSVGKHRIAGLEGEVSVYAVPFLWLAGIVRVHDTHTAAHRRTHTHTRTHAHTHTHTHTHTLLVRPVLIATSRLMPLQISRNSGSCWASSTAPIAASTAGS